MSSEGRGSVMHSLMRSYSFHLLMYVTSILAYSISQASFDLTLFYMFLPGKGKDGASGRSDAW